MPIADWKGAGHGVTAAMEYKSNQWHMGKSPEGFSLRFFYFPPQNGEPSGDFILNAGIVF